MCGLVQRKVLSVIIVTILIFSMVPNFVDATSYQKTYYNLVYYASTSIDDAYYLIGYEFSNTSTLGYLKSSSYDNYVGFRFQDIVIPSGAVLDNAYISLYSSDTVDGNSYFTTIKGINHPDASGFSTFADLLNANLLSSYINWNMKDLEGGIWRNTTDIKTVLDDIFHHTGWISGNNVAFRFDSAKSSSGTRSFRTYDYGSHQYAPKLYIRYYTLSPITEDNPPNEIEDNYVYDVIELVDNNTAGYQLWKIYNYTYINSLFVYDYTNAKYKLHNGTDWNIIASSTGAASPRHRRSVDWCYGDLYSFLAIKDGSVYDLWLYKSIDNGISWSQVTKIYNDAIAVVSTSISIADSIGVIYCAYLRSSHPYYKTYDINTLTLSSETALTYGSNNNPSTIEMMVSSKANWRIAVYGGRGSEGSGYIAYWNNATSLWNYLGISSSATYDRQVVSCALFEDVGELCHAYFAGSISYPYVGVSDLYMDSDYSYQRGSILSTTDKILDVEFELDASHIIAIGGSYAGAYPQPRLVKVERTGEKAGSESSFTTMITSTGVAQIFCNIETSRISYQGDVGGYSYYVTFSGAGDFSTPILFEGGFFQGGQYYDRFITGNDTAIYIVTDEDGNIIWTGDILPTWLHNIPDLLSISINGKSNGTYWLFKGEVYNLTAVMNNTDIAEFNFTDGVHTISFYYNNFTKSQRLYVHNATGTLVNENVATGISTSKSYNGTETTISYKFMLNLNIVDSQNKAVYYEISYCDPITHSPLITVSDSSDLSFNIYNLGGLVSYTLSGDGGHVLGGSPFEIYATNSTLNSFAYSEMIYRRLQSVHMLVELNTDNKQEADHLEPLVNVGYYEIGFDYKLDGHEEDDWITGWSGRVYISEIDVGTYGAFSDSAYVAMTVLWYNHGDFIRGDQYLYSYHWGYDKTAFPTHRESITFWADLWFDKANSSTVFGGRINAEYYGYYEDGSNWWFGYGGFRPIIGNTTASMIFGNIRDDDGNIIPSKNIGLVRLWEKVAKTASAGDDDTYTAKPFQVFSLKVAQDRMDGLDTPVFIEPKQLNVGGYSIFDPLLGAFSGIGSTISGALFGMGKVMIGGIDTILSWVGLPYGTFSGFVSFVMIIFTSLIGSMANVISMISKSLTLITTFITTIVTFVDYIISIILFFGVDLFSIPLQIIALLIAVLNGGTINFYGIPLDFTPYAPLMVALKTLLPPMGGIMLTIWILWGNITMSGEPDIIGAMHRIVQLFGMMRTLYTNTMWIFIRIRNELISIYNFLKSHIPGMGGGGGTIEEGGGTTG